MLDFAISFYDNYTFIFYIISLIAVILEWPITVLALSSFIAPRYWLWFWWIFLIAFIWDFFWDLIHFYIWKFWKNIHAKIQKNEKLWEIIKKIDNFSYLDKLIIIKYTPPITSIWLIYLWASKWNIKEFIKKDWFLCIISSLIVSFIWYFLWEYLKNEKDLWKILFIVWICIILFFIFWKFIFKLLTKKIYKNNN